MNHTTNATLDRPLAVIAGNACNESHDLAMKFAENGYDIIVAAGNPSVVEEAEEFKELGVDAVSYQLDLSTPEGIEQLYRRVVATGRPVESLVISCRLSEDNSQEKSLALKILKDMSDRGHGRIMFASSKDEDMTKLQEEIKEEARTSGVQVSMVNFDDKEIYFLKEGYQDPPVFLH